ncbi:hypothetical protein DZC73_20310 [Albitalea terrae]|uniref:Porin n=2 Tax=Piscinibacter terrae TaxID=2496871 RepID=A0A3N7HKP3_9BURK|nr:hypothetical protein DZC73_20310 [Albitalea terrae]
MDAPATDPAGTGPAAKSAQRSPAWTFSAFMHTEVATINDQSRLNPGNTIFQARDHGSYVETRLNASDTFGGDHQGRWQFKTYTTSSSTSPSVAGMHSRVDELYADWKAPRWFATVGKRRINWGHALGFNPVNVVAPARNPLDPSFATEGQPIGWVGFSGDTVLDLLVTHAAARNTYSGDRPRWGARWSVPGDGKDFAVYAFGGAPYPDGRSFPAMLGGSFSMNAMPGLTLYGELAHFSKNYRNYYSPLGTPFTKSGPYSQAAVGSQLDLGGKSSAFVELFINGAGYSRQERSDYLQALDAGIASASVGTTLSDFIPLALNRQYLLLGYKKEYREKYSGSVNVLVARDGSFSNRLEAAYAMSDYLEAKLSLQHDGGGRGTEFGNSPTKRLLQLQLIASF